MAIADDLNNKTKFGFSLYNARVVELVDTQDLKSCGHCGCAGSIPAPSTSLKPLIALAFGGFCYFETTILLNLNLLRSAVAERYFFDVTGMFGIDSFF